MLAYEDPATWGPKPVRPRWQLVLRFIATVVCFPVLCVVGLATFVLFIALAFLTELIAMFSSRYERGFGEVMESALDRVVGLGSWFVTWPQLRHEGDTEYYRAKVDKVVADWTARASAPPEPDKAEPPVECEIALSVYRGVGGRYLTEVALAQGWELRPSDVRKEVRLRWSAATRVDRPVVEG
ncbi:hypothetical protein StrepF001_05695 [Streptomyces sp. F001]|uniref:hypothetical protein n=1 Tax=Streptomyces sp. F001 TaxID=1510026 RepID=UPI00101E7F4F|nr:hypothetical protein [Streptomyces sp. F001]RZB20589.1 hypothetical protein StrepF001_05695 [Streptomyces sp. F001]